MDSEHLAGCSSLTADGMISKLDELLWDHEEPYLEELTMDKLPEMPDKQPEWQIDPNKASSEYHLQLRDKQGWHSATAKYDGCVDLWKYHNVPLDSRTNKIEDDHRELADYIHYCNIDEEIARLQALKKMAVEYFKTKGYSGYWDEERDV